MKSMLDKLKELYYKMQEEEDLKIEALAYAHDNNLTVKPNFDEIDLNESRPFVGCLPENKFVLYGRMNRIFILDENFQEAPFPKIYVKLHDGQKKPIPLFAGAVLKTNKIWTNVEIYHEQANKKILIGYGMDVEYQQNLVTLPKNTSLAQPDAALAQDMSVEMEDYGQEIEMVAADDKTLKIRAKNTSGVALLYYYETGGGDDYGKEWSIDEWKDFDTQSAIFLTPATPGYVAGSTILKFERYYKL